MPKIRTLTLAMSAVSMMAGCASTQPTAGESGLRMEAVQTVTHGQNNPQAFYQLGRYYHGQTRYDLAMEAYRQALSLQPQFVDALTGMGVVHASLGQYDDALRVLKAAASLDPDSVTAQNNLGYVHWLRNEHDEARQAYRQALKLDPMNARARDNLRLAMKDAGTAPSRAAADRQPEAASKASQATASISALREVGPQVYELRAPVAAASVRTTPGGEQSVTASFSPAPVHSAAKQAGSGSGLAMNEVAPQVYELRMPVPTADRLAPLRAPDTTATAERTAVQAAVATPVSPAAADSVAYLEVKNGNGVNGMANKVSRYLAGLGYPSAGAGNQPYFNEARTRIEYRPGHAEQARQLSGLLPGKVTLTEVASLDGHAKIRLVLGKDLRNAQLAWNGAGKIDSPVEVRAGVPGAANALPLVVANGNGVKGMARKVAAYLSERGYRTTSVYDMRPFNKTVTRIEYRKGYASQAIKLGGQLPGKVAYVESNSLRTDVRLVLGHDIKHNMAAWSTWLEDVKLAEAEAAVRL